MDMKTVALSSATTSEGRRVPLSKIMALSGIPVISPEVVRDHKRATIDHSRLEPIFRVVGPAFYLLGTIVEFFRRKDQRTQWAIVGVAFFALINLLVFINQPAYQVFSTVSFCMLAAISLSMVILFMYHIAKMVVQSMIRVGFAFELNQAMAIWERQQVYEFDTKSLVANHIPGRLHRRVQRASEFGEVFVEWFNDDPLIVVTRSRGLFLEQVYIGGWDTGVSKIDNA